MNAPLNISLPPGGVLVSLGADIIEIERIRGVMERHGQRFVDRILTDEEKAYCTGMAHPHKHIAARFAAKEAVSKCFTKLTSVLIRWLGVSVTSVSSTVDFVVAAGCIALSTKKCFLAPTDGIAVRFR